MAHVGTWAWAELTGGQLRRRDRAQLIREAVKARLRLLGKSTVAGPLEGLARLELPEPPDSAVARAAEERVLMLSEPVLYAHCVRTWAFAALFADRDGIRHDPELLYLACLLHDLGLTTHHVCRDRTAVCFAVEGARAAEVFLRAHQVPETKARAVAEAISLHLNVSVATSLGAEAALLNKGAALDAVGRYAADLPRAHILGVTTRWPRDGFAGYLIGVTREQAQLRPDSRCALLHRFGFARMASRNPLDHALHQPQPEVSVR